MARTPDANSEHLPRRYRLLKSLQPEGLSEAEWARRAKVSSSFFQDLRKGAEPRLDTLEKVLGVIRLTPADLYAMEGRVLSEVAPGNVRDHVADFDPFRGPQHKAVPLLGSAMGGEYGNVDEHIELIELDTGDPLQWLARPPSVQDDPDAYALTVLGDSMSPLFDPGTRVMVSPRAPVQIGDNVVVQLRGPDTIDDDRVRMVLIKRFLRRTASGIELQQFNPEIVFPVPTARICADGRGRPAIHKVVSAVF